MTCAFVPPKPKELTPAMRLPSRGSQASRFACTRTRSSSNGMCGFGVWKWRLGGSSPWSIERTTLMSPAMPAAASRWPMFVLTEPIAERARPRAGPRRAPRRARPPRSGRRASCRCRAPRRTGPRSARERASAQRVAEDRLLRLGAGRGQAVAEAVVVHRGAADDAVDAVAVGDRVRQPLEHHHAAALAAYVPVGPRVERLRPTVRRHRAEPRHHDGASARRR